MKGFKIFGVMLILCIICSILTQNVLYAGRIYNIFVDPESENFRRMDYVKSLDEVTEEADKLNTSFGMLLAVKSASPDIKNEQEFKKLIRHASHRDYNKLLTAAEVLNGIKDSFTYFPVAASTERKEFVSYEDSFLDERTFGGNRKHEGTDIMPAQNISGLYPIVSVSDGTVMNAGWLTLGGYRLSIKSSVNDDIFFYYAHLASYAEDYKPGDTVKAGQLLGLMGDTGYGSEGTTGEFMVHLHFGIYFINGDKEISINPYYFLNYAKKNILRYKY